MKLKNKLKKLSLNTIAPYIIGGEIVLGSIGGTLAYEFYEKKEEVSSEEVNTEDIYTNEAGELCCEFDIGKHKISISRNDAFYHEIEAVEGYEIETVKITGWLNNNKVTYINKEPVVVKATGVNHDGKVEFARFGEVIKNKVKEK